MNPPAQLAQWRAAPLPANPNKLLAFVEKFETSEGLGIRVRREFDGKAAPQGYERKATAELIETTQEIQTNFANRHGSTKDPKIKAAFEKAQEAVSPQVKLDDVVPSLFHAENEEEASWLVQTSRLRTGTQTYRVSDFAEAFRAEARANAEAVVAAAHLSSGGELKVNDGTPSLKPTLNGDAEMFLFDENRKVLQWNHAVIFGAPDGYRLEKPLEGFSLGTFNLPQR